MKIDLRTVNSKTAQVADEGLKFLDVRIFAGLAELDFQGPIVVDDPAVNPDVETCQPLLGVLNQIEVGVQWKLNVHPADSDLLKEEKLVVVGPRVDHRGDLGIGWIVFIDARRGSGQHTTGAQRQGKFQKAATTGSHDFGRFH